jgi:serine/threonine protein kinase
VKQTIMNKYEIDTNPIGKGYYGTVYRGYDLAYERAVAVKITSNIKRACREVEVMKRCGESKYLPVLYDFIVDKNKACIVMELIKGKELEDINSRGKLTNEYSIKILISILKGLHSLHQRGYSHRDTKPKNILMINNNPQKIKIIDFNVSGRIKSKEAIHQDLRSAAEVFLYLINGTAPGKKEKSSFKSKKLKAVILKALNKQDTYNSASEFIDALNRLSK